MVLSSNYERERGGGRQVMELADGEGGFCTQARVLYRGDWLMGP